MPASPTKAAGVSRKNWSCVPREEEGDRGDVARVAVEIDARVVADAARAVLRAGF